MKERKKRVRVEQDIILNGVKRATALDLSEAGMYLFTSNPPLEGLEVNIEFTMDGMEFDVRGKVKHVEQGVGFGVGFTDMDDESARKLKEYIESC